MQETDSTVCLLEGRCLVRVSGADAGSFLQNLVTNDITAVGQDNLAYACLLTPQGRFLHDFFISRDQDGFYLECETQRRDDLIRRLTLFRLRAKVSIEDCFSAFGVYASAVCPKGVTTFPDPRLAELGYRWYLPKGSMKENYALQSAYQDRRIRLGVPEGTIDIKPETDTIANANLDHLHAVSQEKGCYVGQEITAMTENRGVVKRRMLIVSGRHLAAGENLVQNGHVVGEIRSVNTSRTEGLAILKLTCLGDSASMTAGPNGELCLMRVPGWLHLENTP